jgi:hypothetical protein
MAAHLAEKGDTVMCRMQEAAAAKSGVSRNAALRVRAQDQPQPATQLRLLF